MATANSLQEEKILPNTQTSSALRDGAQIDLAVLTLDDTGVIRDCSEACKALFGFQPDELLGCHVTRLLPQLPNADLVQDGRINARLAHLCHCGFAFQARRRNGAHFAIELFINRLDCHNVVVLVRSLESKVSNGVSRPFH